MKLQKTTIDFVFKIIFYVWQPFPNKFQMYCILPAMIENDFNLDGQQNILTYALQFENLSDLGVDLLNAWFRIMIYFTWDKYQYYSIIDVLTFFYFCKIPRIFQTTQVWFQKLILSTILKIFLQHLLYSVQILQRQHFPLPANFKILEKYLNSKSRN